MQQRSNSDLKVGLTVLIGIAVLVIGIGWAKSWRFDRSKSQLVATFSSVSGLEKGDPVYIRGLKQGVVDNIIETTNGPIVVTMELYEPVQLHHDASASVAMLELMGGKKIDVLAGSSGSFDPAKDTITGSANGDLSSIVSFANSLTGTVQQLALRVDTLLSSINDMFGNGALRSKAYATLDNASAAVGELRSVLRQNRTALTETLTNINLLAKSATSTLSDLRPNVNATLDSVRRFVTRSQVTLGRADSLLVSIGGIITEARENKSVLYKLTSDKQFSHEIDSTLRSVKMLIDQISSQGADVNLHLFR
ncbi:MAG TPA: MlaD family protein [Candidatus Kapabacteria bacterium]|nr:MlaD family protein [Candidatus Kapabacteria bacterium]